VQAVSASPYLDGQLLIAMPGIGDPRFDHTVIYLCAHSDSGAMGIIVNKKIPEMSFADLLARLAIVESKERALMPEVARDMPVQYGGPVEPARGFVLHSPDYQSSDATLPIDEQIALTATLDILRAIAGGEGPSRALLALGYAGWGPGQLESEIQRNGWLSCAADEDIVFGHDFDRKYMQALQKIGVDPSKLSSISGHA
jgi:putative transcriptional regulator